MYSRKDIEKLIQSFYQLISDKIKVDGIYLFGSYANGEAREYSDIDIAVLSSEFQGIRFYDRGKLSKIIIHETYPELPFVDFEIHPYKTDKFTEDDPFVTEILRTGKKIV